MLNYIMNSDYVIKPVSTAAAVYVIDQFIMRESNQTKSFYLGIAGGVGAYAGLLVGANLPDMSDSLPTYLGNGKSLIGRVAEVGFGVGGAYAINRYVLNNNSFRENAMNTVGTLIAGDILGEYVTDYIQGRPLSILQ